MVSYASWSARWSCEVSTGQLETSSHVSRRWWVKAAEAHEPPSQTQRAQLAMGRNSKTYPQDLHELSMMLCSSQPTSWFTLQQEIVLNCMPINGSQFPATTNKQMLTKNTPCDLEKSKWIHDLLNLSVIYFRLLVFVQPGQACDSNACLFRLDSVNTWCKYHQTTVLCAAKIDILSRSWLVGRQSSMRKP